MSTFVLVHGAWHGGWCWQKLAPLLEAAGHRVLAPDLPGRGPEAQDMSGLTLDDYADFLSFTLAAESEPVILVGHSLGGAVITQAAEFCPSDVGLLVYLAAYVPGDGESVADWALSDVDSLLGKFMNVDWDGGVLGLDREGSIECLYDDCSDADRAHALQNLSDEPLGPVAQPLCLSEGAALQLPAVYIECLRDRTVSPIMQSRMQERRLFQEIHTLDSGHSPFYSRPDELAEVLQGAGERILRPGSVLM
ncbi:MAG: alpha/beta fold hydrolase [Myxococcota bacterium]|nr:alpha/beta fold hydrolase [Myxococcota bacterium]